jgi:dephospho-CoA kinase/inosine/xanthosine triphosphate pyrophosphatase family protein
MRPQYGDAFRFERILNVYFYTSNADKLLQARLLFMRHGYTLRHFKGRREPYDEDYSLGTERLLARAIEQVNAEFSVRSIFFVEDTSLYLEALSRDGEFPGLAVKEWFAKTTFEELDREIRINGGNRRAIVKSDVALYVPTLSNPIFFHGETEGAVALSAPNFTPSGQYPWLTPETFNGWFIPNGSTKRLGEMEFEESLAFDFRSKSLGALIARLEELNSAINLAPNFYAMRRPQIASVDEQLSFSGWETSEVVDRHVLLIVGHKCAGKTTLSDHLASREGVMVFEASSVLRSLALEADESVDTADDAFRFLWEHGLDYVAQTIAKYLDRSTVRLNVVTGLRTVEEISLLLDRFIQTRIVFVDSDSRTRFERHLKRARDPSVRTFRDFEKQDEEQAKFGVLRVPTEVATDIIRNDGTLEQYKVKIDTLVGNLEQGRARKTQPSSDHHASRQKSELHRTLSALRVLGQAATCEAISKSTIKFGMPVRKYNTNRALKSVPEFAERVKRSGHLLSYRLTARGDQLLELLDKMVARIVLEESDTKADQS